MDRNTVIGFSLLAALLIGYVVYNQKSQEAYYEQKKADSIAYAKAHPRPIDTPKAVATVNAATKAVDSINDSIRRAMPPAFNGTATPLKIENKRLVLQFSTKGAFPVHAELKDYKTYGQKPLVLFDGKGNELSAILPGNNGTVSTADLFYTPTVKDRPDGGKEVDFMADLGEGKRVDIIYNIPADDYMMTCNIHLTGMSANSLPLTWQTSALHTEKDIVNERTNSQVYYQYLSKDHDYFTIRGDVKKSLEDRTHWLGIRMHFFNSTLVADEGFSRVNINSSVTPPAYDSNIVAHANNTFDVPVTNSSVALRWYIGPNHYKTLHSYKIGMEEMVPLGYGVMAFVKYINKWLIIPIFNTLSGFIGNYGIIIMLMTIIIRLCLSFFTYKSYLSAAKMRVLKPELDELRLKYKDEQQKFGMEQMKLYKSAGVNPLGGCLPTLLQMPFLFAMYYFFPSSIELRQKSFLWAQDLSTYDSIAHLPFKIPGYGDHISLFTLLMTASSLFLALYNRNMTAQDPNNPMMKWMPFIFPFILLGVFNQMAAALTFYYFFSNMISITQQFVIQKYFIDEKAIHAKLMENRNKPVAPSKWQQRLEEMQKAQQERGKQQPRINKK